MHDSNWVVIRTFLNVMDAEIARGALEAAEINAVIRRDDAGGVHPGMWSGLGVQLLVAPGDVARAEEILTTYVGPIGLDPPD